MAQDLEQRATNLAQRRHAEKVVEEPVEALARFAVAPRDVEQHQREIDPTRRRRRIRFLHDVLAAQQHGLVLEDQRNAALAGLEDGAVHDELFAGL